MNKLTRAVAVLAAVTPATFPVSGIAHASPNTQAPNPRAVMGDWDAGKGTPTSRDGATVDGWHCVGNTAGIYSGTGVLSYCDSPPNAHMAVVK